MTAYWLEALASGLAFAALGLAARHLLNRGERR